MERAAHVVQKSQALRDGDGPGEVFDDIVAVIEAEAYQRTVLVAGDPDRHGPLRRWLRRGASRQLRKY